MAIKAPRKVFIEKFIFEEDFIPVDIEKYIDDLREINKDRKGKFSIPIIHLGYALVLELHTITRFGGISKHYVEINSINSNKEDYSKVRISLIDLSNDRFNTEKFEDYYIKDLIDRVFEIKK